MLLLSRDMRTLASRAYNRSTSALGHTNAADNTHGQLIRIIPSRGSLGSISRSWTRWTRLKCLRFLERYRRNVARRHDRRRVVPGDRRLHQLLHPFFDHFLISRAERMRSTPIMNNLEAVGAWIAGISEDFVAMQINVTFDFLFLEMETQDE